MSFPTPFSLNIYLSLRIFFCLATPGGLAVGAFVTRASPTVHAVLPYVRARAHTALLGGMERVRGYVARLRTYGGVGLHMVILCETYVL